MLLEASVSPAADAKAAAAAGATTRRSPGNSRSNRSIARLSSQASRAAGMVSPATRKTMPSLYTLCETV